MCIPFSITVPFRCVLCAPFPCLLDNVLQPVVLQQAEPAEMDRPGEAAEKAAGQVRARAHRLLRSRVLHTQCHPAATGDHKVRSCQSHVEPCYFCDIHKGVSQS